jgi:predicted nucleotidyltransferase component of viral defense system
MSMEPTRHALSVEQFHLLFLVQLSRRLDQRAIVVKGGCNLRFFLRSIRYSEDMDLDVGALDTQLLRDKVREILASRPFRQILQARGIEIEHVTEHKQTETTQRWKLGLRVEGTPVPLPTKVEFSRRGLDDGVAFGSVDPSVARAYQLPPLMLSHYDAATALRQKVGALAGRLQTQARDVFDLHHLLAIGTGADGLGGLEERILARAGANALSVDFGMFTSQVLAYLPPEDQARFGSSSVWDSMVLEVVDALGRKPS